MKITVLPVEEALGKPLAHDLTQVDIARGTGESDRIITISGGEAQ